MAISPAAMSTFSNKVTATSSATPSLAKDFDTAGRNVGGQYYTIDKSGHQSFLNPSGAKAEFGRQEDMRNTIDSITKAGEHTKAAQARLDAVGGIPKMVNENPYGTEPTGLAALAAPQNQPPSMRHEMDPRLQAMMNVPPIHTGPTGPRMSDADAAKLSAQADQAFGVAPMPQAAKPRMSDADAARLSSQTDKAFGVQSRMSDQQANNLLAQAGPMFGPVGRY